MHTESPDATRAPTLPTVDAVWRPDTVLGHLDAAAARVPDRVAFVVGVHTLTYAELSEAADGFAALIRRGPTVPRRVALVLPSGLELPVALFGAMRAGAQVALLNPTLTAGETAALLAVADPDVIVTAGDTAIPDTTGAATVRFGSDATIERLAASGGPHRPPPPGPADGSVMLFTGGTTGRSKAAEHSHASLVEAVEAMAECWPTGPGHHTWLAVAPMFHVWGLLMGCLNPVRDQATVVVHPRFLADQVIEDLVAHRVAVFGGGPPAIYSALLASPRLAGADLAALRCCPSGGAPLPPALAEAWRATVGLDIIEGYGMSEVAPISAVPAQGPFKTGSVGVAAPGIDLRIDDLGGNGPLPAGEDGEVVVRSARTMRSYLGAAPDDQPFTDDGFLRTGDVGHLDEDGFLFLVGRCKELIKVNGFNVYPREIDDLLVTVPGVSEAGTIGVPDDRSGERPVSFVVADPGVSLDPSTLHIHCRSGLARYKWPAAIDVIEALPRTGANKTDRAALRALWHAVAPPVSDPSATEPAGAH